MISRDLFSCKNLKKPSFWVFTLLLLLILSRFAMLNVQNWNNGYISNGMPGVKLAIDSERYLSAAENMSKGVALQGREYQFAGYIGLLAIIKTLNLSLNWVVVVQLYIAFAVDGQFHPGHSVADISAIPVLHIQHGKTRKN